MFAWMMALLLSSAQTAGASGWACEDCCRAAGLAGCPTRVRMYGDGSLAVREGAVWRIKGLWWLDCDAGPSFDPGATVVVSEAPRAGEIIRLASPPATVRCFEQACADALPHNACIIEHQGDIFRLARCSDQQPLSDAEMRVSASPQPRPQPQQQQSAAARAVLPLPPLAVRLAPIVLPEAPGERCQTSALVAEEAARRLVMGDGARVSGDLEEAVHEYLAAITMDRCSVNGWAALGTVALSGGRLQEARAALQVAVRLDGGHYGAQTALGEVEERLGQRARAAAAYRAALAARPDHAPAQRGLARLGGL